jgi:hypothetical protein
VFFASGAVAVIALNRERIDRRSAWALLAVLIPLTTMLYIPLRHAWAGWPNLIGPDGVGGHRNLWRWITGTAENVSEANTLGANRYALRVHSTRFLVMMIASLSPAALVLVPAGLRSLSRDRAYLFCGLLPSVVTSVVVLTTPGAFAYRHVGLLLTGAIACGVGIDPVFARLRARVLPAIALVLLLLVPPVAGVYYLQRSHREARAWAYATLAAIPRDGQILAFWPAFTPLRAVQQLDAYRRDVRVVPASGEPWKTGEWRLHPSSFVAGVTEDRDGLVPGGVQVVPTTGLNIKGLSGLSIGAFRVGYPLSWARTFRPAAR